MSEWFCEQRSLNPVILKREVPWTALRSISVLAGRGGVSTGVSTGVYLASIYPGNWDHGAAAVVAVVGGTGSRLQDTDTQVAVLRHTRASDQQHLL